MRKRCKHILSFLLVAILIGGVSPIRMLTETNWSECTNGAFASWRDGDLQTNKMAALRGDHWLQGLSMKVRAASYSGYCGDNVMWSLNTTTGTMSIEGTGKMTEFFPSSAIPWYSYRSSIRTVSIGDGITSICFSAFKGCANLISITIPDSVKSIGNNAFDGCTSLTSVTIPYGVKSTGNMTFYECKNLTSITIPDSVTRIEGYSFYGCSSLTSIILPSSVKTIETEAFYGCKNLNSIVLPDSITGISESVFYNTGFYNNSENWVDDVLYIGHHLIRARVSITGDYSISEGTLCVAAKAFDSCSNLTCVTFPQSIVKVGEYAFRNCTSLSSAVINAVNCTTMGSSAYPVFYGCSSLQNVSFDESISRIPSFVLNGCSSISEITIPNSVTIIGYYAFAQCTGLVSIVIPNNVEEIWSSAFNGCSNLESITIGEGTISIGEKAFFDCEGVSSVFVPNGVTSIGTDAFSSINRIIYNGSSSGSPWGANHHYKSVESVPSCTEEGKIIYSCVLCEGSFENTLPALGHDFGEWHVTTPPTATQEGEESRVCTRCGETETRSIVSNRTSGDSNGDGVIDLKDVVLLRRFLIGGWNVTIDLSNADVNADGVLDLKDVVLLRRYLSGGWDVVLK